MNRTLARLALRLALCLAVSGAVWRFGGLAAALPTAALFGVALATALLDLAGDVRHAARTLAWRRVSGRHYAYRGQPVDVVEDDDHHRWIRAADVRRVVGHTVTDGAWSLAYPDGVRAVGRPPQPYWRAEDVLAHLAKQRSDKAIRFRRWVERDVAFPARRRRGQRERLDGADTVTG